MYTLASTILYGCAYGVFFALAVYVFIAGGLWVIRAFACLLGALFVGDLTDGLVGLLVLVLLGLVGGAALPKSGHADTRQVSAVVQELVYIPATTTYGTTLAGSTTVVFPIISSEYWRVKVTAEQPLTCPVTRQQYEALHLNQKVTINVGDGSQPYCAGLH